MSTSTTNKKEDKNEVKLEFVINFEKIRSEWNQKKEYKQETRKEVDNYSIIKELREEKQFQQPVPLNKLISILSDQWDDDDDEMVRINNKKKKLNKEEYII